MIAFGYGVSSLFFSNKKITSQNIFNNYYLTKVWKIKNWYCASKIVFTYCEKKIWGERKSFVNLKRKAAIFLRSIELFIETVVTYFEGSNQIKYIGTIKMPIGTYIIGKKLS